MAANGWSRGRRWAIILVSSAMGIGAVGGGLALLHDAEGFGIDEAWLSNSPFPDYRIPAVFLMVVIGGGMLVTAALALSNHSLAGYSSLAMGAILILWLAVETLVIGLRGPQQVVLLVLCGASGFTLYVAGRQTLLARWRRSTPQR